MHYGIGRSTQMDYGIVRGPTASPAMRRTESIQIVLDGTDDTLHSLELLRYLHTRHKLMC